jgi:hypothetical protein
MPKPKSTFKNGFRAIKLSRLLRVKQSPVRKSVLRRINADLIEAKLHKESAIAQDKKSNKH